MPLDFIFPQQESYSAHEWNVFIHMNVYYLLAVTVCSDSILISQIELECRRAAVVDGVVLMDDFLTMFYFVVSYHDFELHRLLRRTAVLMIETNQ